jgi:hypothetical protein
VRGRKDEQRIMLFVTLSLLLNALLREKSSSGGGLESNEEPCGRRKC